MLILKCSDVPVKYFSHDHSHIRILQNVIRKCDRPEGGSMSRFIQEVDKPQKENKDKTQRTLAGDKGYDYKNLSTVKDIPLKRGK